MMVSSDDNGALWKGILGEWKIDYRDPTADRRLVEFSLRIPTEQLIHGGEQRAILRKFLADRVPREVLDNRLKGYQAADWHEWLTLAREGIADEIARMDSFEPAAEILDLERLKGLLERWPAPGADEWNDYEAVAEYRCCLLRAISAVNFMRQAAGSNQ
jgi:asparagine synthase (glutamine-hydrolysing)